MVLNAGDAVSTFPESNDSITFTLNGTEISPEKYEYAQKDDGASCEIKIAFTAIPPTRKITVSKVDGDNEPLAGATISISGTTERDEEKEYEAVSDGNGFAKFTVEYGSYTVFEKEAPEGYQKTDEKLKVTVNEGGLYDENDEEITDNFVFVNEKRTPILVRKTDTGGRPLAGAVIRLALETPAPGDSTQYKEETTGADGTAIFYVEDILSEFQGSSDFILSEASAPSGYRKTNETYRISVDFEGVYSTQEPGQEPEPYSPVTFINTRISSGDFPSIPPPLLRMTISPI